MTGGEELGLVMTSQKMRTGLRNFEEVRQRSWQKSQAPLVLSGTMVLQKEKWRRFETFVDGRSVG